MKCPSCGFENKSGVKFCVNCGTQLQSICSNCGTANAPAARFCTTCGCPIGAAPPLPAPVIPPVYAASPQPVVVVSQGSSGWLWAVVGILIVVIAVGGLGLGGILPLSFLQKPVPTPTLPPVIASTKTPEVLASVETYCPREGGVILYWNVSYDCRSELGDPGYRYRVGDGAQDLNTGEFDNQASALYIPIGWSVRLYENAGQKGASVCFNSSTPNFEARGNFPDKTISINDNVSSMEVFADGTCGEDLAAGAEPAPWPKNEKRIHPTDEGAGNEAGVGEDNACHTDIRCGCVPAVLDEVDYTPGDGEYDWELDSKLFQEKFIDSVTLGEEYFTVKFKPESGKLADWLSQPGMDFEIQLEGFHIEHQKCLFELQADGGISCRVPIPRDGANKTDWVTDWGIYVSLKTAAGWELCSKVLFGDTWNENINPAAPTPVLQCTNPHKPQVCGDICCNKDDKCVQRNGNWRCDRPSQSGSGCSSSLGSLECGAAGGTWDPGSSSCSCP